MQLKTQNKIKGPHIVEVLSNIKLSDDTWKLTFQKIASSRMGGITAGHLTGFRSKGNKSIKKLQKTQNRDSLFQFYAKICY